MRAGMKAPRYWNRMLVVRPERLRQRDQLNWRIMARRRAMAGLTSRGTIPKRRTEAVRVESHVILAHVDALALALAKCFNDLPPDAQARLLELENRLSAVRSQLV